MQCQDRSKGQFSNENQEIVVLQTDFSPQSRPLSQKQAVLLYLAGSSLYAGSHSKKAGPSTWCG